MRKIIAHRLDQPAVEVELLFEDMGRIDERNRASRWIFDGKTVQVTSEFLETNTAEKLFALDRAELLKHAIDIGGSVPSFACILEPIADRTLAILKPFAPEFPEP